MKSVSIFFQETLKYLKQSSFDSKSYELIEPHLLYLSEEQSQGYLQAMDDKSYSGSFHNAIVEIINTHLPEIFSDKLSGVSLIDLGPGFPDKTIPIADFLKNQKTDFYYYPVDISPTYLELAERTIRKSTPHVFPIHCRFEEIEHHLPKPVHGRENFVMIGLTFMNFQPEVIFKLLKSTVMNQGHVILATELITDTNTTSCIVENYRNKTIKEFAAGPICNLGFELKEIE
jgi:hypothetical protein